MAFRTHFLHSRRSKKTFPGSKSKRKEERRRMEKALASV
jgi:hypothetical protein